MGEASPLPGFSKESLYDVKEKLEELENKYLNTNPGSILNEQKLPSLKFAIEQAVNSIIIDSGDISSLFGLNPKAEIKINGFVPFRNENVFKKNISQLLQDGFEVIKIKIGRKDFTEDLKFVSLANNIVKESGAKIRVDANGAWNLEDAKRNLEKLEYFQIDYVEQPVRTGEELAKLSAISKIPLAADEALVKEENIDLLLESKVSVFVLKPMLLGGLNPVLKIKDKAEAVGKQAIISTTFESPVGLSYLIYGASIFKPNLIHGIPPIAFAHNKIGNFPFPVKRGKIIFDFKKFPLALNFGEMQ